MSQLGPGTKSGGDAALPSSSASSSRRDGSDLTVPATPPTAHQARADHDDMASPTQDDAGRVEVVPGASRPSAAAAPSSSTFGQSLVAPVSSAMPAALSACPSSSQTTIPDSQESAAAAGGDARRAAHAQGDDAGADAHGQAGQELLRLSAIAAAQQRIDQQEASTASRKRMADGQVKPRSGSNSPIKGHARTVSAMSTTSTGSQIMDMSADLKTRLTYAMIKVNNGWQSRSLDEVESLASQAASPVSSNSTLHRRQSSSTSPRPHPTSAAQVHFAPDPVQPRHGSRSPPARSRKPVLAPPAPIQPSLSRQSGNGRRNTIARHPPALLTHSHSASAASSYSPRRHLDPGAVSSSQPSRPPDAMLYSPHQNVREQDAIETLLFMSSPNNSTNLRHAFSPSVSPAPPQQRTSLHDNSNNNNNMNRHTPTSSSSFRKGLPGQRPAMPQRRVGFDKSPAMGPPPPGSPMDLDSPQQQQPYRSPNVWTPKRRANGVGGHIRGALSLPSGLGLGNSRARPALCDEDIDRILDRAAADSSDDDDDIQLPPRTSSVAGAVGI
ncbi:hypothetical protein V2A60_002771 [Cordyceps javanica]